MKHTDLQMRAFSQIAYMDMADRLRYTQTATGMQSVPLSELLSAGERKELLAMGVTDKELDTWKLAAVHDTNAKNGFYACVIETGKGETAVAFRGSEGMDDLDNLEKDWIKADLALATGDKTEQQAEVERFLKKNQKLLSQYDHLSMTGHSLGGNLADYATIVSDQFGLDDKITQCVSLDGPGFSQRFIREHRAQIAKMSHKMVHYKWSFVGTLLHDLPGVQQRTARVSNENNHLDQDKHGEVTRHNVKYIGMDEQGKIVTTKEKIPIPIWALEVARLALSYVPLLPAYALAYLAAKKQFGKKKASKHSEMFYLNTSMFRELAGEYSSLPQEMEQMAHRLQAERKSTGRHDSSVDDAKVHHLLKNIRILRSQFDDAYQRADESAALLRACAATVEGTIRYLRETAEEMDRVEEEAVRMIENWSARH